MEKMEKVVNGYRFLPPALAAWIKKRIEQQEPKGTIPWSPLTKPLNQVTIALVTSAGINVKTDPPFDMEREKREATWGGRSDRWEIEKGRGR